MEFLIYLHLEPYLAEWYLHENENVEPVHLKRGSAESDIVELFLTKLPKDAVPDSEDDANVRIVIPYFRARDPMTYNYLPPRAKKALAKTIYTRFRVQLWEELHRLENTETFITDLIYAWMEKHGISCSPENCETIRQCYYRKRKTYSKKSHHNNTSK